MNIIKRIGVALTLVLGGSTTKNQAKELIESYPNEFGVTIDNQQFNELKRRSEHLAYIEGCGYELKGDFKVPKTFPPEPPDEAPVRRDGQERWQHGVVEDAVLRSIDRLQKKRFISGDVWAEYVRAKEPMTTKETVFACVSIMARRGLIQQCNPPRKIGNSFVYEKQ